MFANEIAPCVALFGLFWSWLALFSLKYFMAFYGILWTNIDLIRLVSSFFTVIDQNSVDICFLDIFEHLSIWRDLDQASSARKMAILPIHSFQKVTWHFIQVKTGNDLQFRLDLQTLLVIYCFFKDRNYIDFQKWTLVQLALLVIKSYQWDFLDSRLMLFKNCMQIVPLNKFIKIHQKGRIVNKVKRTHRS